jgi:hypothetical protein
VYISGNVKFRGCTTDQELLGLQVLSIVFCISLWAIIPGMGALVSFEVI